MNTDELSAQMETAWALECETSSALRALIGLLDKRHVKMVWTLGYARGRTEGLQQAKDIIAGPA